MADQNYGIRRCLQGKYRKQYCSETELNDE
jgi:hypothetical protein